MELFLLKVLIVFIIIINIVSFVMMGIDKKKAEKHKWRIKESTLFLVAILGGSLGSILGMQMYRHKTKHLTFTLGMPAILILQIIILFLVIL